MISENMEFVLTKEQFVKFQEAEAIKYKSMHKVLMKDDGDR